MGLQDMGFSFDDDELDTTSKLSSEDSGEVGSLMEDSDDSYSLELGDMEPSPGGQMTLLEEIMDSLSSSKVMDQGRLSAAKSLDFFRSSEDVGYAGPNTPTASSDPNAASAGGVPCDGGDLAQAWHLGQDDSVLHGKHLPPSPRRQSNKSSLRGIHRRPPLASPARPITIMAPGVAGSGGGLAASPLPPRFSLRPPPVPTNAPAKSSSPPRWAGASSAPPAPLLQRPGARSHGGGPVEALVPWEKEPCEQAGAEVGSGEAGGSTGGVQEKGLLEEIEFTLRSSPRLHRGTINHAGARRVRSRTAADEA
ncbi:unnamed protein product [Lota lota]